MTTFSRCSTAKQLRDRREPLRGAGRRAGEREAPNLPGDLRELLRVAREVVDRGPRVERLPVDLVPRKHLVQLGLVADLERLDVFGADAGAVRVGLGRGLRRAVVLQVDAQDQLRAGLDGEGPGSGEPALGQRVGDAGAGRHARKRPPRAVGAVAADPQHRRLTRRDVPDQRHEHRVDRAGIRPGVVAHGRELEREADETGRDRLADPGFADANVDARRVGVRGWRGLGRWRGRGARGVTAARAGANSSGTRAPPVATTKRALRKTRTRTVTIPWDAAIAPAGASGYPRVPGRRRSNPRPRTAWAACGIRAPRSGTAWRDRA